MRLANDRSVRGHLGMAVASLRAGRSCSTVKLQRQSFEVTCHFTHGNYRYRIDFFIDFEKQKGDAGTKLKSRRLNVPWNTLHQCHDDGLPRNTCLHVLNRAGRFKTFPIEDDSHLLAVSPSRSAALSAHC